MSMLVEQQDETIATIETQAGQVNQDMEQGYVPSRLLARQRLTLSPRFQSEIHRAGCDKGAKGKEKEVDLLLDHQYVALCSNVGKEVLTLLRSRYYHYRGRNCRRYHLWPREMQVGSARSPIVVNVCIQLSNLSMRPHRLPPVRMGIATGL